jgi:dienelactone hydrolase
MPLLVPALALLVTILGVPSPDQRTPDEATAHARTVLGWLSGQEFSKVEEQFTDRMKSALPAEALRAMWTNLLQRAGALKRCGTDAKVVVIADKQMVITPCEFERAAIDLQFAFDTDNRISGLVFRPATRAVAYTAPSYVDPSSFVESETTVGAGEWALPGTLSLPSGAGPFPAVVLVAGSGPNDRDETVGAAKPFKDLAGGLASRGIAVLRYDKRTKVHGAKLSAIAGFTVKQEVVDDALEGVRLLRAHPKIDRARVFVLGHSLGGLLIPRIGAADPALAGLIVMAGPARSLEEAMLEQTKYVAMADGAVSPDEQARIDEVGALVAKVKALTAADATSAASISGAPAAYWLDLRGYDAPSAAKALKQPLLVLQGERDYQVTMAEFEQWKAALAGHEAVTFHSYPALNHLFIAGTGKSVPAEYQTAGHVADAVVTDIAVWILKGSGL